MASDNDKLRLTALFPDGREFVDFVYEHSPIHTNSVSNTSFDLQQLESDTRGTRIVVHPKFPSLVEAFLAHKREQGSSVEKELYGQPRWDWKKQTGRLIAKRPLVFMGSGDFTTLRDGTTLGSRAAEWDRVGTESDADNAHLHLDEYLSYDEMMLGSLVGVSGPSYFINDGGRYNAGEPGAAGSFEPRGVIVGLVGARFERPDRMDCALVLPPVRNPRQHPRLTRMFYDFLGVSRGDPPAGFDVDVYTARMRITIDTLLLEADARAAASPSHSKAYVYVVGLGLGVWMHDAAQQTGAYLSAFAAALRDLPLPHIGTIEFAYLDRHLSTADRDRLFEAAERSGGIDVVFSRRNPAARLPAHKAGQLLVLSYAWDGNAFPGNEYWEGSLVASGDPAAACMSTVAELHNPLLNPGFLERILIVGKESA